MTDTNNEIELIKKIVNEVGVQAVECKHWANGSKGIEELAKRVVEICDNEEAKFKYLYKDSMPLIEKIKKIATEIYHADEVVTDKKILNNLLNGKMVLVICQFAWQRHNILFLLTRGCSVLLKDIVCP